MIIKQINSSGITRKYLFETRDDCVIETTYIKRPRKHIVCISTQIGCPLKCTFCISGSRGFRRSLSANEMVTEFETVYSRHHGTGERLPFLLSFMGEGEPFLNLDACIETMRACYRYFKYRTEKISFAVSTSGVKTELLEKLAAIVKEGLPLKLQVSFHSPVEEIRKKIVPVSDPLPKIIDAVRSYQDMCQGEIDWNYVLCKGINDDPSMAELIPQVLPPNSHVKFNQLNPSSGNVHVRVSKETVDLFRTIVEKGNCTTEYYETDGSDIFAACGQLSYSHEQSKA